MILQMCDDFNDDCNQCLNASLGCVFQIGYCMNDCNVMDVACYVLDSGQTAEQVCQRRDWNDADNSLCNQVSSCSGCVNTYLTEPGTEAKCRWHEQGSGFCAAGGGMMGPGVSSCGQVEVDDDCGCDCVDCMPLGCEEPWCAEPCEDGEIYDKAVGCCGACVENKAGAGLGLECDSVRCAAHLWNCTENEVFIEAEEVGDGGCCGGCVDITLLSLFGNGGVGQNTALDLSVLVFCCLILIVNF